MPKLTIDKRCGWRPLAKRRIGVELKSAPQKAIVRPILYGTDEAGTHYEREILKRVAEQFERICTAMVRQQRSLLENKRFLNEDLLFDPKHPVATDGEQILAKVAKKLTGLRKHKT